MDDPYVTRALKLAVRNLDPDATIYDKSPPHFVEDLRWTAAMYGVQSPDLTAYALRRGGATWHFGQFGSIDTTANLGRWEQSRTAKIYIQGALSDLVNWKIDPSYEKKLLAGKKTLRKLLM